MATAETSENLTRTTVMIDGKPYEINCPHEKTDELISAASYLDNKIQAMRANQPNVHTERIAIITALNLTHELLAQQKQIDSIMTMLND